MPVSGTVATGTSGDRALAAKVHQEVNRYRLDRGARMLPRHPMLDRMAQQHADYLVRNQGRFSLHGGTVSHYGFDGRALMARERLGMNNLSENVAMTTVGTSQAPADILRLWAGSRNHEHNMNSNWSVTGVGVAVAADGTVVATQLFGTAGHSSHQQMVDKFRSF
jgi:uncharacterized protein YkwD